MKTYIIERPGHNAVSYFERVEGTRIQITGGALSVFANNRLISAYSSTGWLSVCERRED